jgi:leucyl aminopeptidase
VHIDLMAWNLRPLPGRPEGGEAMGMRAVFELIRQTLG